MVLLVRVIVLGLCILSMVSWFLSDFPPDQDSLYTLEGSIVSVIVADKRVMILSESSTELGPIGGTLEFNFSSATIFTSTTGDVVNAEYFSAGNNVSLELRRMKNGLLEITQMNEK